jgi:hypothetical protein
VSYESPVRCSFGRPVTARDYMAAARVPHSYEPGSFGLWTIERRKAGESVLFEDIEDRGLPYGQVGWPDYTLLRRITLAGLHLEHIGGEVVMEDSQRELRKHLPIWMKARGKVLVTGLGLGCVVRGLLAKPDVEAIDVVEIDAHIIRKFGPEFERNPRVTLHQADALSWDFEGQCWDYAWHDLHSFDETHLDLMHIELFNRFMPAVPLERQGAWAFPRSIARLLGTRTLQAPR